VKGGYGTEAAGLVIYSVQKCWRSWWTWLYIYFVFVYHLSFIY